jgi:hypothetical protein
MSRELRFIAIADPENLGRKFLQDRAGRATPAPARGMVFRQGRRSVFRSVLVEVGRVVRAAERNLALEGEAQATIKQAEAALRREDATVLVLLPPRPTRESPRNIVLVLEGSPKAPPKKANRRKK